MTDAGTTDPAVLAAADGLARAETAAEEAAAALRAAEGERDGLRAKLGALDAKRREIGARRVAGDVRADDAGELALIAADAEALGDIVAQRDTAVAAARAVADRATAALEMARHVFSRAEAAREQAELLRHAEELAQRMITAIDGLGDARKRLGGGIPVWGPPAKLMDKLNVLKFYHSL